MFQKRLLLNQSLFLFVFLLVLIVQNHLWPVWTSLTLPLFLWPAFLVYSALYRGIVSAVFMVYFVSFFLSGSSSVPLNYILVFNSFVTLLLLIFRRIYSINILFFSLICALILFLFPAFLFLFAGLLGESPYVYGAVFWIGGAFLSWLCSFPFFQLFRMLDNLSLPSKKRTEVLL